MTDISFAEYQAACRADFYTFMTRCFADLHGSAPFLPNWHMEVIAAQLQDCLEGRIKRLIINLPPRHLKSHMASIAFPAFWLGHRPNASIINVTYGQALSDKFARECRSVMTSGWYAKLFATRLINSRAALQDLTTTAGGSRFATSVNGVLTGRGADLIIIDDPLKPDEAMSEAQRRNANEWYDSTLYSRLNHKAEGCIIIIMQRLHENDLVGHVLEQEGWELLSFPALAEADEEHVVDTVLGPRRFTRKNGEALHPAREPTETIQRIRETIGTYNFAGQYQQSPAPAGGGMVKEAWFQRYDAACLPASFDRVIQSWDTANKPSELADYSVCTTWGMKGPHFYLLNVYRKQVGYPQLKRAVLGQFEAFGPGNVLIEDKASGTQLIQELIEAGLSSVVRIKPEGDKTMRLNAQTATIENGFVHLPREAHWLADFLHEVTVFPRGRYDDQVDSLAQVLAWTKKRPAGWGFYELCRRENERLRHPAPEKRIRLKAPRGTSHVGTWSGEQLVVDALGCVDVIGDDVPPLTNAGFTFQP
jgi:predicted phage terminase large subunit-like protein